MKKDKTTSQCCKAPVIVEGSVTRYFICTGCGKPCDLYVKSKADKKVRMEEITQPFESRDFGNGVTGNMYKDIPQQSLVDKINEIINYINKNE